MKHVDYVGLLQKNIRRVMKENGYNFVGGLKTVTERQLYRIESGVSIPKLSTIQKIVHELDIPLMDLFEE